MRRVLKISLSGWRNKWMCILLPDQCQNKLNHVHNFSHNLLYSRQLNSQYWHLGAKTKIRKKSNTIIASSCLSGYYGDKQLHAISQVRTENEKMSRFIQPIESFIPMASRLARWFLHIFPFSKLILNYIFSVKMSLQYLSPLGDSSSSILESWSSPESNW